MSKLGRDFRKVSKAATQYPAIVVDTHGSKASARLSTNGATIHNLSVVGGPVDIGDSVLVDYTTPEPTVIAFSKSWLTMDDLLAELAKIQLPPEFEAATEYDKFIVTQMDDVSQTFWSGRNSVYGLDDATNHMWNLFPDTDLWPDLVCRFPPGVVRDETDEYMQEYYDGGVVGAWIGDSRESTILNMTWATQINGQRFESLAFRAVSTYSWTTSYNLFFWYQTGSTYTRVIDSVGRNNNAIFKNCTFHSLTYPEDSPYQLTAEEANDCIPMANIWITGSSSTDDVYSYFIDCSFFSRAHPSATRHPSAIHYDYYDDDIPGVTDEVHHVYLNNCIVDCGPEPFNEREWFDWDTWRSGGLYVYAYNCKFLNYDGSPLDPTTLPHVTILDDGDRSPINHIHTSGSSGGYDPEATHYNEAGEW